MSELFAAAPDRSVNPVGLLGRAGPLGRRLLLESAELLA